MSHHHTPDSALPTFLRGGGSMARLIAEFDWSTTPLGDIGQWPVHLRLAVANMLRSSVPMTTLWGDSGVMIYNDGYAAFSRQRHPGLLGMPVRDAWPEAREFNDNVMRACMAGGTLDYHDKPLELNLHGTPQTVWFNLNYSPISDEQGVIAGVFVMVHDTTAKVQMERRLVAEREQFAQLFEQSPSFMAMLEGPEHRITLANPGYRRLVGQRALIGLTMVDALPETVEQGYVALLDGVYRSGEALTAHGARYSTPDADHYVDFVFQPIRDAQGQVTGIFVEGVDVTGRMAAESRRAALAQFTDLLRSLTSAHAICGAAAELLGRTLCVSRAGYALIDHTTDEVTVPCDWTQPGVESIAGQMNLRRYGSFVDDLKRDRVVCIADVRLDERTRDALPALRERGVAALLNMPVLEQGELVALLFANHAQPREWTGEEVAFLREVAGRTRTAVERARTEAQLREMNEQLERKVAERTRELIGGRGQLPPGPEDGGHRPADRRHRA